MTKTTKVHRDLKVLDALWDHFADGLSPAEVARASGLCPSGATRALQSLRESGYAEQIQETSRWRVSHRIAAKALGIVRSLDRASDRLSETQARLGITTR